jgi:ubiquinone/menaquinone biosynthesis C-methylase UbiE
MKSSNLRKYGSRNPLVCVAIRRFLGVVKDIVKSREPAALLDAGCGEGFVLEQLECGGLLVGLDVSLAAVKEARSRRPDAFYCVGDVRDMPFMDCSFSVVLCIEVLEHLGDSKKALNEIARVSSGSCVLSVPDKFLYMAANLLRLKNLSRWGEDEDHLQSWSGGEFVRFVGSRLRIEESKTVFPWIIVSCRVT